MSRLNNPLFVAISDIHFNVNNLDLASYALEEALMQSKELRIPLVVAGDLHDTKAIIRGEVANRLLDLFKKYPEEWVYILVGNHDLINEKGNDNSLNFLRELDNIFLVSTPVSAPAAHFYGVVHLIPYQNSNEKFKEALANVPKGSIVVCHQGVQDAYMGDYVQDKTSVEKEALEGYKIISGHYHRHQTIGTLTYIGSPFTHTFGEAQDGAKGYLIVNSDGTFKRIILDLRKHVKLEVAYEDVIKLRAVPGISPEDRLWLKITGPKSKLSSVNKEAIGQLLLGHSNYKLDLIVTESDEIVTKEIINNTPSEVLDGLIDATKESKEQKEQLKQLYRSLL